MSSISIPRACLTSSESGRPELFTTGAKLHARASTSGRNASAPSCHPTYKSKHCRSPQRSRAPVADLLKSLCPHNLSPLRLFSTHRELLREAGASLETAFDLANPSAQRFFRYVQFRRTILALLCALGWLSGVLHEKMEAADWMMDHHHHSASHHEHESDVPASHDSSDTDAGHAPVWARDGARVNVSAIVGLFIGLLATLFFLPKYLLVRLASTWCRLRPAEPSFGVVWQFVWRCAAPSAAPPAR